MYGANDLENSVSTFLSSDLSEAVKANDEATLGKSDRLLRKIRRRACR